VQAAGPQAAQGLYLNGIGTQKSGRRGRHRGNTSSGAVRAGSFPQYGHGRGVSAAHLHQESGFDFTLGFCALDESQGSVHGDLGNVEWAE